MRDLAAELRLGREVGLIPDMADPKDLFAELSQRDRAALAA